MDPDTKQELAKLRSMCDRNKGEIKREDARLTAVQIDLEQKIARAQSTHGERAEQAVRIADAAHASLEALHSRLDRLEAMLPNQHA